MPPMEERLNGLADKNISSAGFPVMERIMRRALANEDMDVAPTIRSTKLASVKDL